MAAVPASAPALGAEARKDIVPAPSAPALGARAGWGDIDVSAFAAKHSLSEVARSELSELFRASVLKVRKKVTVRVPAASANLGPCFDCCGLALDIWNELVVERAAAFSFEIEGEGAAEIPRDKTNLCCVGLEAAFKAVGKEPPTLRYRAVNRIPNGKGLGSSSAGIVSGILAGLALAGYDLHQNSGELLQIATLIEGHPDTVGPTIYGGMQIGYHDGELWRNSRVQVPHGLMCVVFCPDHTGETKELRDLLKAEVDIKDAIFNVGRAGLLVAAFATNNLDWLRAATEDALHQPQRAATHLHLRPLIQAALDAGAHGAALSGSGPAIIAFTSGRSGDVTAQKESERQELAVAEALLSSADKAGVPGHVLVTKPVEHGGYVVSETAVLAPEHRRNRIQYIQD